MADYKRQNRMGGSKPRAYAGNSFSQKELFDAECNSCHKRCQVPFRPNGKKPVYCANCFTKSERHDTSRSSFHNESRPQRSFATEAPNYQIQDLKREIESMNATLQDLVTAVEALNRPAKKTTRK